MSSPPTAITQPPANGLTDLETIALYIHIPFCHKKCHYCDFNSFAGMMGWRRRYVRALTREIALVGEAARLANGMRRRCRTIFFGGGTPSLLPPADIAAILAATHAAFAVDVAAEVTLEANPATLERGPLPDMRAAGINRLSMGAQSFDADLLRWMGRIHSPEEIISATEAARAAGFDNINLDFIFALPDQTMDQWQSTLDRAVALAPDHLSLYSLIVEPETPLFDWVEAGTVIPASEDCSADMYEYAQARLAGTAYEQYEISNWARPGKACQHNLTYWRNLPYLAVGAGAHASFGGRRFSNAKPLAEYIDGVSAYQPTAATLGLVGGPVVESETISHALEMGQTAMLALRLHEGLDLTLFACRFGVEFADVFGAKITDLRTWGLIEEVIVDGTRRIRLTERGRLVGNEVFERFLPDSADH